MTTKSKTKEVKKATKEKELDQKNAQEVSKKITDQKDLMYKYPEDCSTLDDRKAFRRKARAALKSYRKKMNANAEDEKALKKLEKEMNAWKKETYAKPGEITI